MFQTTYIGVHIEDKVKLLLFKNHRKYELENIIRNFRFVCIKALILYIWIPFLPKEKMGDINQHLW